MAGYALRRLLLIGPTLLLIVLLNFLLVQAAPGGPIEQMAARLEGGAPDAAARLAQSGNAPATAAPGASGASFGHSAPSTGSAAAPQLYRGSEGLDPRLKVELEQRFGFDRPWGERFLLMLGRYATLDLGESFFSGRRVADLIGERLPVSAALGALALLLAHLLAVPLGIWKATRAGSRIDTATSFLLFVLNAVPTFLLAVVLLVLLAGGGSGPAAFPLRGLTSPGFAVMGLGAQIADLAWHLALPVLTLTLAQIAQIALLTKGCFLEELGRPYVVTARAKGLSERALLTGHVFRNAMLVVIASFPAHLIAALFTGALLVEIVFSLEGLGLLGFEAALGRDYPVVFGTLFVFSLVALALNLVTDLLYAAVDPRVDFAAGGTSKP